MSAPVAIPAAPTAGQTPGGNAWAQGAASPATGFEALLAALFPTAPAGLSGAMKGLGLVKSGDDSAAQPQTDQTAAGSDSSALQAQLAALLAAQPAATQPTAAVQAAAGDSAKPAPALADKPDVPAPVQPSLETATPAIAQPVAKTAQATTPPAPTAAAAAPPPPAPTPAAAAPTEPAQVLPAADPKAAPPPAVLAAALPLVKTPAEPAPEVPAEPAPAAVAALAASAEAKPAPRAEKPEAPAPSRATAAAPATTASATQAESATVAQAPQPGADHGEDRPSPDQHDAAPSDRGAPDVVAGPAAGPGSAAHMIQAEAAATAARGAPETVAKLAAQLVKKLEGKSSRFDIALDPAGLGKVDVKVEINAQGQMTAALNFDTAAAAAELRGRAGELRAALEQAGFDMSNSNLSFSFAGQGDTSGQAFAQQDGRRGGARFLQALADDQPLAAPAAASSLLGSRTSGVDVRI